MSTKDRLTLFVVIPACRQAGGIIRGQSFFVLLWWFVDKISFCVCIHLWTINSLQSGIHLIFRQGTLDVVYHGSAIFAVLFQIQRIKFPVSNCSNNSIVFSEIILLKNIVHELHEKYLSTNFTNYHELRNCTNNTVHEFHEFSLIKRFHECFCRWISWKIRRIGLTNFTPACGKAGICTN